jgi:hypothetical protein
MKVAGEENDLIYERNVGGGVVEWVDTTTATTQYRSWTT